MKITERISMEEGRLLTYNNKYKYNNKYTEYKHTEKVRVKLCVP